MYACSPDWKADWISDHKAERILSQLTGKIRKSPGGYGRIGINQGLHFTGGEPFLNFDLLLKITSIAHGLKIPSTFVETNSFWCVDDDSTKEKLEKLKYAGLDGILISVNPFILEYVPFERTERAIRISQKVFNRSVIVYQDFFRHQFYKHGIQDSLSFEQYLRKAGVQSLSHVELIPMGRACYKLGKLFKKHPAKKFFGQSCRGELTRPWHVHIDNYGNYMAGYCAGISLGDACDLDSLRCINLNERPILSALVGDIRKIYDLGVKQFNYDEPREGYISKCHLCLDIRRHIVQQTEEFKELSPRQFYQFLNN